MNKLFFVFVFVLISINFVSAFGITPAQKIFDYNPDSEQTHSFQIVNSENKRVNLVILPQGELAGNIALSHYYVTLTPETPSLTVTY